MPVRPSDASAWADAIERLVADSTYANALRRRGFERVKHFSWDRAAQATRDVYREALLA